MFIHHSTDAKHELISRFLYTKVYNKSKNKCQVENSFEISMKSSDITFQNPDKLKLKTEIRRILI